MRRITLLVVLLFFVSGAAGLVSELVWVRLLTQLLGGTTFAISVVLASFMAGLALGSWRFGPRADRESSPLRLYARLELGAGVASALVPLLLAALKPAWVAIAPAVPEPLRSLLRVAVAVALMLPPTFFMGGTLPVLGRFLVRSPERIGRSLGLLYAVNTFGAVAGAFGAAFVLIPALGLVPAAALGVAGNLAAAAGALLLARKARTPAPAAAAPAAEPAPPPPAGPLSPRQLAAVFALTGFAAMGCELYWTRALHHFLGNTTYAFSTMLSTFLAGLAAGGWLGGRLADRVGSPARLLGATQVALAACLLATVPLIWNWLPTLEGAAWLSAPQQGWTLYLAKRFLAAAAVMIVPTVLGGMTFPVVNRLGVAGPGRVGRGVGSLYAANTAGSIAGSLAAGFAVLPLLGARRALLATALLSGAIGVAVLLAAARRDGRRGPAWAAVAAVALLALLAPWLNARARQIPSDTQRPGDVVLFDREDPTAETRVYRKPDGELHMSVDGRHIGGTEPGIVRKEKILAHLPVMLVPRARQVLAVGLGSGITLGALSLHDEVERLDVVEIVPSVVDGARLFREANRAVLDDPRVRLVVGDGVQHLLTTRARYDVISSDSKLNPEFVGNSAILAREYYELCRDRLTDDGVMIQWTVTHLPNSETRVVTRSFLAAFPYAGLFWIDPSNVILVGSKRPLVLDADRWAARLADPEVRADLQSQLLDDPAVVAAYLVAGRDRLAAALGPGPQNTWLRPRVEFETVREFQLKPITYHETDNLRWLFSLWSPQGLPVTGAHDAARLARFRFSTGKYLEGYTTGGGTTRLTAARPAFAEGLAGNPDDFRLAHLLQILDREQTAAAGGPAPADAGGWIERGLRLLDGQRPAEALAAFDRALALDPGARDARYDRLLALRQLGRADEALRDARAYVAAWPRDARGHSFLGRSLVQAGDVEGAVAAFRTAVGLDPSTASFVNNLATALAGQGRFAEAAAQFEKAFALDPALGDAAYFAAAAWSRAGDQARAWRWVETCLDRRLGDPSRFLTEGHFADLRASPHWQSSRVEAAIAR